MISNLCLFGILKSFEIRIITYSLTIIKQEATLKTNMVEAGLEIPADLAVATDVRNGNAGSS